MPARGLTLRSVLVALVLAYLGTVWMRRTGIISLTVQLGESVPPIPAVAGLCLFLLINPLLARIRPQLALTRPEMVVVFVILSITPVLNSVGMLRMLLPSVNVAQYFATPENHLSDVWELVPSWYGPRDPEIIRQMYEGADNERVPWSAWLPSIFVWGSFAGAFFLTMLSLNVLLRKQWTERERLAFPMVQFVSPLVADNSPQFAAIVRNPLLWVGMGLTFLYNLLNMLQAVNPSMPAPGKFFNLGALFTERPWSAIQPLVMHWRPEVFGLGYLMSTEITLSVWVCYVLVRLSKVLLTIQGSADQIPGFPFDRELSMGSYLVLTASVLWVARKHLGRAFGRAFLGREAGLDDDEPASYRWAFIGFFGGFAYLLAFAVIAGMAPWLALVYFSLVVGVSLTYTRIRAETGAPFVWLFPFWEHQNLLVSVLGSRGLVPAGEGLERFRSATVLHGFAWLSRGFYSTAAPAAQIEAFKLADETATKRRDALFALLLAVVFGLALAYWAHLSAYYKYGGNVLEGGSTEGGYRIRLMTQSYTTVGAWMDNELPPDKRRITAYLAGALVTGVMVVLRTAFLRFPLHPLGFAMATAFGHTMWGMALLIWAIKSAVLRIGGVQLYKRLIPLFIGIVLGHFFTAGVIWGTITMFNEELAEKYAVWFG